MTLPMFFSFTEHSLLHQYPHMRAECHWHVDLELTYIIHGHMWYFVNGETVRLDEGQAIFVNSRQLHYGFTKDGSDCEFSCTLLNPAKMCASFEVYDRFIAPLMAENTMPYAVITDDTAPGSAAARHHPTASCGEIRSAGAVRAVSRTVARRRYDANRRYRGVDGAQLFLCGRPRHTGDRRQSLRDFHSAAPPHRDAYAR